MGRSGGGRSSNGPCQERSGSNKRHGTPWGYGIIAILSGVFFSGFMAATIALTCVGMQDTICNGIEMIKRGEQLICHPNKTQDVKVSYRFSNVTAYRYKTKMLPETEVRTTKWMKEKNLSKYSSHRFRVTLSAGGAVNFTYQTSNGTRADFYLMTTAQLNELREHDNTQSEWSERNTSFASTIFTTNNSGVYYIIADARYERATIEEEIIISTPVYKVSTATAEESYTHECEFKKVHKDEIVILEYFGIFDSSLVNVYSGKAIDPYMVPPLVTVALLAAVFFAGVIAFGAAALKKVKEEQRVIAIDRNDTPQTTSGTTPSSDPAAPLIPNSARVDDNPPPVYHATDLPEYGI